MRAFDAAFRADALIRATLSLGDGALRARYLVSVTRSWPVHQLASTLDVVCGRAEQAEASSREALVAIVDALNLDDQDRLLQHLREEAAGRSLLSLERLVRHPSRGALEDAARRAVSVRSTPPAATKGAPETLTLGQRKSLARRADRETVQRLLLDSHPAVVERCLAHPRLMEEDVVRLSAKRLARGEVLAAVAKSRWLRRPRVRLALALNPNTPLAIAARILGLLLRPELELVANSPHVPAGVRALCREHLARRPPVTTLPRPESGAAERSIH